MVSYSAALRRTADLRLCARASCGKADAALVEIETSADLGVLAAAREQGQYVALASGEARRRGGSGAGGMLPELRHHRARRRGGPGRVGSGADPGHDVVEVGVFDEVPRRARPDRLDDAV